MGHDDFYPFVIPAAAYEKLAFVHRAIRDYVAAQAAAPVPGKPVIPTPPSRGSQLASPERPVAGRSLIGRVYDRLR